MTSPQPSTVLEQPAYVFWTDPRLIAHGTDQERWHQQTVNWPTTYRYNQLCAAARERLNGPIASEQRPLTTADVRRRALGLGSRVFGVTAVNPSHVFAGRRVDERFAVCLGLDEDRAEIDKAPSVETNDEVMRVYYELGEIAIALAAFIREHGYAARAHHPLGSGDILVMPHAIAAGLGELGKHGSMLNAEYGSLLRLALVTTDLQMELDAPRDTGLADVCSRCRACEAACPPDAISSVKQDVRGSVRYIVELERCLPYFLDNYACAICIRVCPWNEPRFARAALRQYAARSSADKPL
jgi:epoxyqueuosine reductase